MNPLQIIESRFKEVTKLPSNTKIDYFPITEHIGFKIRLLEKKDHGEVFTPLNLVDRMINISKPNPDKFNMDLCAGHGQFTIRLLRKFYSDNNNFDVNNYLENVHWFNELNLYSALELIYIFGDRINLAIGPAEELKRYPQDTNEVWQKGIFYYDENLQYWVKKNTEQIREIADKPKTTVTSKQLF